MLFFDIFFEQNLAKTSISLNYDNSRQITPNLI